MAKDPKQGKNPPAPTGYSSNKAVEGNLADVENRNDNRPKRQEKPSKQGTPNLPGQGGLSTEEPAEGGEDVETE